VTKNNLCNQLLLVCRSIIFNPRSDKNYMAFCIVSNTIPHERIKQVNYQFSIWTSRNKQVCKKGDVLFFKKEFESLKFGRGCRKWIEREEFFKNPSNLNKKNLKILCRLEVIEKAVPFPWSTDACLISRYEKLFNNEKYKDFTIVTSDKKEIRVHKNVVCNLSPVFDKMLEVELSEHKEGRVIVDDVDYETMLELMRYFYYGNVHNTRIVAGKLLYAAEKYDVPRLKPACVASLADCLSTNNVIETLILADLQRENDLKTYCIKFIKW